MSSVPSKLEKNNIDELYRKNQVKSISFLVILSGVLLLTVLLSLRAGSYETPIGELIKGIFGMSDDRKINIVVQNNRLPRILTAILAGGGLGLAGCILQAVLPLMLTALMLSIFLITCMIHRTISFHHANLKRLPFL